MNGWSRSRSAVGALAVGALVLAGCSAAAGDPAPNASPPAESVSTTAPPDAVTAASSVTSSPAADNSAAVKACGDFAEALAAVPDSDNAEPEGHFLAKLEAARTGGEFGPMGFTIWLSNYSAPYLPASVPDDLRAPIQAIADQAKAVTDGATATSLPTLTDQDAKALVSAYSDAAGQCAALGAPLAGS